MSKLSNTIRIFSEFADGEKITREVRTNKADCSVRLLEKIIEPLCTTGDKNPFGTRTLRFPGQRLGSKTNEKN